jgi:hypothetical protein
MKTLGWVLALSIGSIAAPAMAANLLVNGNFEASSDPVTTPPGWTNIGHSDGVIPYSQFSTPAYDGNFFYDLGGFGNASGPIGDGIEQTVATVSGDPYTLKFGLTSEDVDGITQLLVQIGALQTFYTLTSTGGFLNKAFTTQTINYVATGASTTVAFTIFSSTHPGFNDPMIDGVSFGAPGGVPEPATWALMIAGFGLAGAALRRRAIAKA